MRIRVVKVSGKTLADPHCLSRFARYLKDSVDGLVVVHGGGPEVSDLCSRLGIETRWVGGRRYTSEDVLGVASMVLSGKINKRLVGALVGEGVEALGLSGEDGGLLRAEVSGNGSLGRVGGSVQVRRDLLLRLLGAGMVPVISPISRGIDGGVLNVNADEVATAVAVALGAQELLFVTDVAGVHDEAGPRGVLSQGEVERLVGSGTAVDGMAVKLKAATQAVSAGVPTVRIGPASVLQDRHAGTRVARDLEAAG